MNPALDIATDTDAVVPGHKLRCAGPRYDPGGGGINVARAVRMLGGEAHAVFPVGGPSGEMLCRLLDRECVPHSAILVDGITRESLAVLELQSGSQYRFLLPGPTLDQHDQGRCLDELAAHAKGAGFLVASGSLPPGVPADFYARVGELAAMNGVRFVLDTSGRALAGASDRVFLLKASLRELEELAGAALRTEADQVKAARDVVEARRAEVVVVSRGAEGALLITDRDVRRFAAAKVAGVGSVGAGDSMVAGIVLSLERGGTLAEAVIFGMAAGAAALLRPGTELCQRDDAEQLYRELTARKP